MDRVSPVARAATMAGSSRRADARVPWRTSAPGPWLLPFLVAGVACVVGGGLLAAATAYVTTEKTAWATAYVVLVGGVAQIALGAAVTWLRPGADRRWGWTAFGAWNLGNAGVLAGQLVGMVALTDGGSALLVVALAVVLRTTVTGAPADGDSRGPVTDHGQPRHPALLWTFRLLLVVLLAGIVVGTVLAQVTS